MKIRGNIDACAHPVVSPLTGASCVGYEVVIRALGADHLWRTLAREVRCADFELTQDGSRFFVQTSVAYRLALRKEGHRVPPSGRSVGMDALIERQGGEVNDGLLWRDRAVEAREGMIRVGDGVVVWGGDAVEISPDVSADGYRRPPLRLVLCGDAQNPVVVSNLPGAHLIDNPFLSRRDVLRGLFRRRQG